MPQVTGPEMTLQMLPLPATLFQEVLMVLFARKRKPDKQ